MENNKVATGFLNYNNNLNLIICMLNFGRTKKPKPALLNLFNNNTDNNKQTNKLESDK